MGKFNASEGDTIIIGITMLYSALKFSHTEMLDRRIQEGAKVSAESEDGESALDGAMARGDNYHETRIQHIDRK